VRGTDHAIWRRLRLVPFDVQIPAKEQDKKLAEKLREELPGILAWIVRGALIYQKVGLPEAERVTDATTGYREEMDTLAGFFADRCVVHARAEAPATPLYNAYKEWADESGESKLTQTRFGRQLKERGFESFTYTAGPNRDRKGWRGIGLRDDRHDDPGGGGSPEPSATADSSSRTSGDKHAHDAPKTAGNRPQRGQSGANRPHPESPIGKGETPETADGADSCGPKNGIDGHDSLHEAVMPEKGQNCQNRPQAGPITPRERRLSAEETERVKRLIAEGMAPQWARDEVLGNEAGAA
jgi:hypothetical protein